MVPSNMTIVLCRDGTIIPKRTWYHEILWVMAHLPTIMEDELPVTLNCSVPSSRSGYSTIQFDEYTCG